MKKMKCSCCGKKISDWQGNFMAISQCDLCYFDLYNSSNKNDHLDVIQENIRFRSVEKLKDIQEADRVLTKYDFSKKNLAIYLI